MNKPATDIVADHELMLSRILEAPPAAIWKAWTSPELVKEWWAPKPWTTPELAMDLRPGGGFRTVMRSPEGKDFPYEGCFLELVPNRRIVLTDALGPGFRPAQDPFFTAVATFEPHGAGTRYTVRVLHKDAAGRKKHEEMGFHQGWGQVIDQLDAVAKRIT